MPLKTTLELLSPEWTRDDIMMLGFFFKFLESREIVIYHKGRPQMERHSS